MECRNGRLYRYKKDVSLTVKRLPFCGCQDSNLEQYIDRMCQIDVKNAG